MLLRKFLTTEKNGQRIKNCISFYVEDLDAINNGRENACLSTGGVYAEKLCDNMTLHTEDNQFAVPI